MTRSPYQVDHVIAKVHGGNDSLENLALAYLHCNAHKGTSLAGIDLLTNQLIRLYHPRRDGWLEHFRLRPDGDLEGLTDVGQATVFVLKVNDPTVVALRVILIEEGSLKR